jgi:hypothetical protein
MVIANSFVEHPAIIEDPPAYDKDNEELKEGAVDAESRGLQVELELNSLPSVADGQTYNTDGGDISPYPAQHRASPEDGFLNQCKGFASSTLQSAS